MVYRLTRINSHQAGVVAAWLYGIIGILYAAFGVFMLIAGGTADGLGGWSMLGMAIIMPILGYISFAFMFWIFNRVVSRMGGIEIDLEQ